MLPLTDQDHERIARVLDGIAETAETLQKIMQEQVSEGDGATPEDGPSGVAHAGA